MEVVALRDCNWTCKKKTYELEKGKKYKFPATLRPFIVASGLFEITNTVED